MRSWISFLTAILFALFMNIGGNPVNWAAVFALTFAITIALGRPAGADLSALGFIYAAFIAAGAHWPVSRYAPVLAFIAIALIIPFMRRGITGWLRPGRPDRAALAGSALIAVLSLLGLYLWWRFSNANLLPFAERIRPGEGVALCGAVFALLNAFSEEAVWRGAVMEGLDEFFGPGWASIILQGIGFGMLHVHGVPTGYTGAALATAYGIALGWIRRRTGSISLSFAVHVLADGMIFFFLIRAIGYSVPLF